MAGMAVASAVIAAASATAQAVNSYVNSENTAKAEEANAKIAEQNAQNVRNTSSYAQDQILLQGKQKISNQFVSALVSGSGGSGTTAENAIAKSNLNLKKDLTYTAYNYENEALNYLNQAKMFRYSSKVAKQNARSALISGGLATANSIVGAYNGASGTDKTIGGSSFYNGFSNSIKPEYMRNSRLYL